MYLKIITEVENPKDKRKVVSVNTHYIMDVTECENKWHMDTEYNVKTMVVTAKLRDNTTYTYDVLEKNKDTTTRIFMCSDLTGKTIERVI